MSTSPEIKTPRTALIFAVFPKDEADFAKMYIAVNCLERETIQQAEQLANANAKMEELQRKIDFDHINTEEIKGQNDELRYYYDSKVEELTKERDDARKTMCDSICERLNEFTKLMRLAKLLELEKWPDNEIYESVQKLQTTIVEKNARMKALEAEHGAALAESARLREELKSSNFMSEQHKNAATILSSLAVKGEAIFKHWIYNANAEVDGEHQRSEEAQNKYREQIQCLTIERDEAIKQRDERNGPR